VAATPDSETAEPESPVPATPALTAEEQQRIREVEQYLDAQQLLQQQAQQQVQQQHKQAVLARLSKQSSSSSSNSSSKSSSSTGMTPTLNSLLITLVKWRWLQFGTCRKGLQERLVRLNWRHFSHSQLAVYPGTLAIGSLTATSLLRVQSSQQLLL
jgi:hypothetical protein